MIADNLFFVYCKQTVRIIVPEICFICKGQFLQILQCIYIFRLHARRIHLGTVWLHSVINIANRIL